jgi:hypothetical protein
MPKRITREIAEDFFDALADNEEYMGEGAALAVTLEMFGYDSWDLDVIADMAMAIEEAPKPPRKKKGK